MKTKITKTIIVSVLAVILFSATAFAVGYIKTVNQAKADLLERVAEASKLTEVEELILKRDHSKVNRVENRKEIEYHNEKELYHASQQKMIEGINRMAAAEEREWNKQIAELTGIAFQ